jgi:hypothetical protein
MFITRKRKIKFHRISNSIQNYANQFSSLSNQVLILTLELLQKSKKYHSQIKTLITSKLFPLFNMKIRIIHKITQMLVTLRIYRAPCFFRKLIHRCMVIFNKKLKLVKTSIKDMIKNMISRRLWVFKSIVKMGKELYKLQTRTFLLLIRYPLV